MEEFCLKKVNLFPLLFPGALFELREMQQKMSFLRIFKAVFGKFIVDGNGVVPVKAGKTEIFPGDFRRLYQVIDI